MTYIIEDNNGRYWTGACWGVRQAAEEYSESNLPAELSDPSEDGCAELLEDGDTLDHLYCDVETGDVVAGIRSAR